MPKNSRFAPGSILLSPFPFSDLQQVKTRPVVVLANESPNSIIVAFVTSAKSGTKNKFTVTIRPDKVNNLKATSYVRCGKILTIQKSIILGKIGDLSKGDIAKIKKTTVSIFK